MSLTEYDAEHKSRADHTTQNRPEPPAEAPADADAGTAPPIDPQLHKRVSEQISAIHRGRQSIWRRLRILIFGR